MKKRDLLSVLIILVLLLVMGCAKEVSEEELAQELDNLSEEELQYVLSEEPVIGEAYQFSSKKAAEFTRLRKALKPYKVTCSDSDGGTNYKEAGYVTLWDYPGGAVNKSDQCLDDGKRLQEYVCEDGKYQGNHMFDCSTWGEKFGCERNACVQVEYCYLDQSLKVGSYHEELYLGEDANIESVPTENNMTCRNLTLSESYQYSKYYYTTRDFAILCTEPCSIDDEAFFQASFEGHILGVDTLREKVGHLPKKKMEFHLGQDGDCFRSGYGEHPTGYSFGYSEGHSVLCNSGYWWYLASQGTNWERNLDYYKTLESQTLTIHEPIHRIFFDYSPDGISAPEYKIQESFAKAVSLTAVGTSSGYDDNWFGGGGYSIDHPPPESSPAIYNFLVYSLNQRFGFNEGADTLEFFRMYRERENLSMDPNLKVKEILDEILGTDTTASFNDVGIRFS